MAITLTASTTEFRYGTLPAPTVNATGTSNAVAWYATTGGRELQDFITRCYQKADRPSAASDIRYWTGVLVYFRAVSQTQFQAGVQQLLNANFAASNYGTSPFRSDMEFVGDLYEAYLQRVAEPAGLNYWIANIAANGGANSATGRQNTLNAFGASGEFRDRVNDVYALLGVGSLSPATGSVTQLQPANQSATWAIAGRDTSTGETDAVVLAVVGELYLDITDGVEGRSRRWVEVSENASRQRLARIRSQSWRQTEVSNSQLDTATRNQLVAFWKYHYPGREFYWRNPAFGQLGRYVFGSPLVAEALSFDWFTVGATLREGSHTRTGAVMPNGQLPFVPSYSFPVRYDTPADITRNENSNRFQSRVLGRTFRSLELAFAERSAEEFLQMEAYWERYFPGRSFGFTDPVTNEPGLWEFDSEISWRLRGSYVDYSLTLVERDSA